MTRQWYIYVILIVAASCGYFKDEKQPLSIARVNDAYLYAADIASLVPPGTVKEDSILLVRNYIDQWASQRLLFDAAEINLTDEKKEAFGALIRQYKQDLFSKAYLEEVVRQTVDTVVTESELLDYYNDNKSNFRTSSMLVRLRYVNVPYDHPKLDLIRERFNNFKTSDRKFWETYQPQFTQSALNDSVWVEMNEVYRRLPFVTPENRDDYIRGGKGFEKKSDGSLYLVKVREITDRNTIGPYEYLKPTLKQVILNKRKLELIKKFETEIINDAIKNKKYEIY